MIKKLLFLLLFLFSCNVAVASDKVPIIMDWYSTAPYYVPFAVGMEKGFFKEEGIDLEIIPGRGGAFAVQVLESKKAEFAVVGTSNFLQAREKGIPIKGIFQMSERIPHSLFCRKDLNISSIKDLEGKSVVFNPATSRSLTLAGFLKYNNLDGKMKLVSGGGTDAAETQLFLDRKVDCMVGNHSMILMRFRGKMDVMWFNLYENGLKLLYQTICVREETLKNNPSLIRRFNRALLKSFEYSRKNVDESLTIYRKKYPEVDYESIKEYYNGSAEYMYPEKTKGKIDEKLLENTQKFLLDTNQIKSPIDIKKSFTNEFIK